MTAHYFATGQLMFDPGFIYKKVPMSQAQEAFHNAVWNYTEKSLYDTGVTAEYGDRLITLVTCSYHEENGRFVVVARQR